MKKRLEQLMFMGILSLTILSSGVNIYAQDSVLEKEMKAAEEPVTEQHVTEAPVTEAPSTEAPVTEAPSTEAPATETPSTEAPATEGTVTEAPATEGTVTEAPVTEAPVTEAPSTEVPTTDAPVTEAPATDVPGTEDTETEGMESTDSSESESETVTEWEVEDALQDAAEIIDNSIDEETIARIEADAKKKTAEVKKKKEEAAKKLYEMRIGESMIDFNAYPAGNITENTNKIYDYLRNEMGFNHAAACGILANIQCESNFAPTAIGDGGTSYGLCQWHLDRFARLVSWCNENGLNYHLVEGQMGYLQYELMNVYVDVYDYVQQVPDTVQGAYDAAYYWCAYYEIPSETIARAKQRGNMAMTEFFPRELGMEKAAEEETAAETERVLQAEEKTMTDLWDETSEYVFQMYRLNIPQEDLLILK